MTPPEPGPIDDPAFAELVTRIRACRICEAELPEGPRPVVQVHPAARILIAGQAPGRRVHESGVPFDDPSGVRLREWMGVSEEEFYDPRVVAIVPMGFCFPGTGPSGDKPPRKECAPAWRDELLAGLTHLRLTLIVGRYAQEYHLARRQSVTDAVAGWRGEWPERLPLPHPSPRNRAWFKRNPWFEAEVLPELRSRIRHLLSGA